jgi:microsomal dipeptidase-like Zn-dependent dipeptidase
MFVDLHCHPVLHAYNSGSDIWKSDPPTTRERSAMVNTANIRTPLTAKFSQIDFCSACKGSVRLIFLSLYPIEQGFLTNILTTDIIDRNRGKLARFLNLPLRHLLKNVLSMVTLGEYERLTAKAVLNMKGARYFEMSDAGHEYMNDLRGEYQYFMDAPKSKVIDGIEYKIIVFGSFTEMKSRLQLDDNFVPQTTENIIGVLFSVEGAHAFGSGQLNTIPEDHEEELAQLDNVDDGPAKHLLDNMLANIREVKGLGHGQHCPFFVTFSHHFWNQLCGHAMSLAGIMHIAFNQERGLGIGMTGLGKKVMDALLSKENGRRILIDVKHMSLEGRLWYYNYLEENFWSKGDAVPVIASHMGVTGLPNTENASVRHFDMDNVYDKSGWFNTWDVNLSNDEILVIHKSRGLIGLNMDQRILSGAKLVDSMTKISKNIDDIGVSLLYKSIWAEPILANILQIVRVVYQSGVADPGYAWQMIAMGSDMDGMINALDAYCHAGDYKVMKDILEQKMILRRQVEPLLQGVDLKEILDGIFYKNALRFLSKNF